MTQHSTDAGMLLPVTISKDCLKETTPLRTDKWEQLDITDDFLFGKLMGNPDLCKQLLQTIFPELNITDIQYPQLQKTIRPDAEAKGVRLDVYVQDDTGRVYNIEMQVCIAESLPQRVRYYQSIIDLQLLDKGMSYQKLHESFIIFICLKDPFGLGRSRYTFWNLCVEHPELALQDGTTKLFLNASGSGEEKNADLQAFLDYVSGKRPENPFVDALDAAVQKAKQNRTWRREYMRLKLKFDDFYESGRKTGFQQGEQAGLLRGRQEGQQTGEKAGIALAKSVFQKHVTGCSNEEIASLLKISTDTVKSILFD